MMEVQEMRPLIFDAIETARMIRRYLRRVYPERDFHVRTRRYRSSGGSWTAILIRWHSMPRDGDIKDIVGNFEMYDLDVGLHQTKFHYLDADCRIYSTWNRALFPPEAVEICFLNAHVWPFVYDPPWQRSKAYHRRVKKGRDLCAPCLPMVMDQDIATGILTQLSGR